VLRPNVPKTISTITAGSLLLVLTVVLLAQTSIPPAFPGGSPTLPRPSEPVFTRDDAPGTREPVDGFAAPAQTFNVSFNETGLPVDTNWNVTLNGATNNSTGVSIGFHDLVNDSYPFTVGSVPSYNSKPSSGTVTVDGKNVTENITFSAVPPPPKYNVTFDEAGLSPGTSWNVTLSGTTNNSTGTSIGFHNLPNDSYAFTIGSVPSYNSKPSSGTVVVMGANVTQKINFTAIPPPPTYNVTFDESGLPGGTSWNVTFDGTLQSSSSSSIVFRGYLNDTYDFTVGPPQSYETADSSGAIHIHGANVTQPIPFTKIPPSTYEVEFNETGLAVGTLWTVTLNGTPLSSTNPHVVFHEVNDTYSFNVTPIPGYLVSPATGSVVVSGVPQTVSIGFSRLYNVTFHEAGLTLGTNWSVALGSTLENSTLPLIVFPETNGSYSFTIEAVTGYVANRTSGSVSVAGASLNVSTSFNVTTAVTYTLVFAETNLPPAANWSVNLRGNLVSTTAKDITVPEPNGTYAYSVPATGNWTASPNRGNVTVSGKSVTQGVLFDYTFGVQFTEPNGTGAGTLWSVSLVGFDVAPLDVQPALTVTQTSTSPTIAFTEPNGTYSYLVMVASDPTYRASGYFTIVGNSVTITPPALSATPPGGSGGGSNNDLLYTLIGAIVIVVLLAIVIAGIASVASNRKKRNQPAGSEEPSSTLPEEYDDTLDTE
jgi:hypothetical protein